MTSRDAPAGIAGRHQDLSLWQPLKRTGKIIETNFPIMLTVANGEIVRFQMLEDSFAVSQAARG